MFIKRLFINDFRNLSSVELLPCPGFNFICGANGSGKTSVLEAVHYLALARSFRTNSYQYLIKQGQPQFNLFALVDEQSPAADFTASGCVAAGSADAVLADAAMAASSGHGVATSIGISRSRHNDSVIRINSDPISRTIDLLDHICVQLIHPQGVDVITNSADERRAFIDWGVYYTYPEFKHMWLQYRKLLRQRNALLRQCSLNRSKLSMRAGWDNDTVNGSDLDELAVWDEALVVLSEQITQKRLDYLNELQELLSEIVGQFLPDFRLKFEFSFGWEKGLDLRTVLAQNLEKERVLGYTLYGCHRADLKIKNNNISAGATLSRGQLKMLVYAMRLAQGMLLKQQTNRACIYLIDDLNSELDNKSQHILLNTLLQCSHQVFISNIQQELLFPKDKSNFKVFHLDGGQVCS